MRNREYSFRENEDFDFESMNVQLGYDIVLDVRGVATSKSEIRRSRIYDVGAVLSHMGICLRVF